MSKTPALDALTAAAVHVDDLRRMMPDRSVYPEQWALLEQIEKDIEDGVRALSKVQPSAKAIKEIAAMEMGRCRCGYYFAPDAALHVARRASTEPKP